MGSQEEGTGRFHQPKGAMDRWSPAWDSDHYRRPCNRNSEDCMARLYRATCKLAQPEIPGYNKRGPWVLAGATHISRRHAP